MVRTSILCSASLPVVQALEAIELKPNRVYVIPQESSFPLCMDNYRFWKWLTIKGNGLP